jgi:hypothetical protein
MEALQAALQGAVLPADDYELDRVADLVKGADQRLNRPHAEASGGDENRRQVGIQPHRLPRLTLRLGFGEDGVDRNPRDVDRLGGNPQDREMDLGLFVGHEIPVHAAVEPHGVGVEISHHHAYRDVQELPLT